MANERVRSRTDLGTRPGLLSWFDPRTNTGADIGFTTSSFTNWEYIRDISTPGFRKLKVKPPHAVFHEKIRAVTSHYPSWVDWNQVTVHRYIPGLDPGSLSHLVPSPDEMSIQNGCRSAFDHFHDQMPDITSLPNFLLELRDVGQLFPKLFLPSGKQGPLMARALALSANGGFLSYQFGWKPLVSDIIAMGKASEKIIDRLEFLRASRGKLTKVNWSRKEFFKPASLAVDYDLWASGGGQQLLASVVNYSADFTASGYMYHELEGLDGDLAMFKAFNSALGLNNPVRTIWNAIPFSFVLEWFIKMDNLVENKALSPYHGTFEIRDVTHSTRVKAQIHLDAYPYPSYGNPRTPIGNVWVDRYERKVGLPIDFTSLWADGLSPTQTALLAALVFSKLKPK